MSSSMMGAQCNLHSPLNPTIMAHLKSFSNSNHFFIFYKGFIFGGGRSLIPSPSSFALPLPFLLALPFYSYTSVVSLISISFMRVISFQSWLDLLMAAVMVSFLIAFLLLCLPYVATGFSLPSYSLLMCLFFLSYFPCFFSPYWLRFSQELIWCLFFLKTTSNCFFPFFIHFPYQMHYDFFCSSESAFPSSFQCTKV